MSEDRPQYQAERDTVPTNAEIAERLLDVSEQMFKLGWDMAFIGGFGPLGSHGRLLQSAAHLARAWAHEIEEAQG